MDDLVHDDPVHVGLSASDDPFFVDFRLLFECLPRLYLVLDPDLRIVAVSEAFLAATMVRRETIVGRRILEVFGQDADGAPDSGEDTLRGSLERVRRLRAPDSMAVQRHEIQRGVEFGGGTETRWLCADNLPVLDSGGELRYTIHHVEDVTELVSRSEPHRASVEKERQARTAKMKGPTSRSAEPRRQGLRAANQGLRAANQHLRAANQHLRAANQHLRTAGRVKNEFLSRMSHELRTPLTAIGGFSELLTLDERDGERRRWAGTIHRASQHLLAIVDDVLDISRMEAGEMAMSVEPVMLSDVLRAALELTEPLAAREGVHVLPVHALPPGTIASETWVLADAQRLKQVVINLVVNAIRYNHRGGEVRVVILAEQGASAARDETVRIEVVDTGAGIDEASLSKLFVAFQRLHRENIPGSGLGLALSRSLVESMGGTIGVSSTVGSGSTFWIDLPRAPEPAATPASEDPGPLATREHARKFQLLYIEDTMSNLRFVEAVLRRRPSVEVLTVMLGNLGLELAREHRPDLILLDLHLPDISGETVLTQLKEHPRTRAIPVVILSADSTDAARAPLLQSGAGAFMTKPISVVALLELVDGFAGVPA